MIVSRTPPLSSEELVSLQEIGKVMQRIILPAHRDLLISLGFLKIADGCPRLTDAGQKRLAAGK